MICQRCAFRLQSAALPRRLFALPLRYSSTAATAPPTTAKDASPTVSDAASATPKSSVLAGTPLTGLGYFKGRDPPAALEDQDYPDWLWGLLDEGKKSSGGAQAGPTEGDEYAKSKKQRQIAARAARKMAKLNPQSLVPKIPLEHQTIDLPAGDGSKEGALEAGEARQELTVAMRSRRRHGIKEGNFLKGMR